MRHVRKKGMGLGAKGSRDDKKVPARRSRSRSAKVLPSKKSDDQPVVLKSLRGRTVREGDPDTPLPKPVKRQRRARPKRMIPPEGYLSGWVKLPPKDASLQCCVSGWAIMLAAKQTKDFQEMIKLQHEIENYYLPLIESGEFVFPPRQTFELPESFRGGAGAVCFTSSRATTNGAATTGVPDDTSSDEKVAVNAAGCSTSGSKSNDVTPVDSDEAQSSLEEEGVFRTSGEE